MTNDSMTEDTLLFLVMGGGRSGEEDMGASAALVTGNAEGCWGWEGEVRRRGPGASSRVEPDVCEIAGVLRGDEVSPWERKSPSLVAASAWAGSDVGGRADVLSSSSRVPPRADC